MNKVSVIEDKGKELITRLAQEAVEETELMMIMDYSSFESKLYSVFANKVINECVDIIDELEKSYNTKRRATTDFSEKNIYAEGEAATERIRYLIKKKFSINQEVR